MPSADVVGASGALLGAGLASLVGSSNKQGGQAKINVLSGAVCIIAFVHYLGMWGCGNLWKLRFSDWLLTCPLLAYEMGIILGKSERVSVIAAVFAFFMILVGYPAVRDGNMASFALSTFFLLAVALVFCASEETSPGDSRLVWPFFACLALSRLFLRCLVLHCV